MNYEIVELEEKVVAGVSDITNMNSSEAPKVIGALWEKFYCGVYETLNSKTNEKTIGLYTDYTQNGDYKVMVCSEVSDSAQDAEIYKIPSGKYVKFIVKGNVVSAVQEFWQKLYEMKIDRSCVCDFEEYQGGTDMDNMEIHMYISIK